MLPLSLSLAFCASLYAYVIHLCALQNNSPPHLSFVLHMLIAKLLCVHSTGNGEANRVIPKKRISKLGKKTMCVTV